MKCTEKSIGKKLKSTLGMSLGEILIVILILLLLTSSLTAVVSLAVNRYNDSMRTSEANVLSSTLRTIMTSELAYTTEIHTDGSGNVTSFQSQNFALQNTLSNFIVDSPDSGGFGQLLIGSDSSNNRLLGSGAYTRNLGVRIDSFTYDNVTCYFTIVFSIGCGSHTYLEQTFQILNVNQIQANI